VNHEVQDAAAIQRAELGGRHSEIDRIVREEVAGRRLQNGETSTRHKKDRRHNQQQAAVADRCLQNAAIVLGQKKILTGRRPTPAKAIASTNGIASDTARRTG
jgi:hypothetical protein